MKKSRGNQDRRKKRGRRGGRRLYSWTRYYGFSREAVVNNWIIPRGLTGRFGLFCGMPFADDPIEAELRGGYVFSNLTSLTRKHPRAYGAFMPWWFDLPPGGTHV